MDIKVKNVKIVELPTYKDKRGSLTVGEKGKQFNFSINRFFYPHDNTEGAERGQHAHKTGWQMHICIGGKVIITLDDGAHKQEVKLDNPYTAILIGPMVWHPFVLDPKAFLFVLADSPYDAANYITDYNEFKKLTKN